MSPENFAYWFKGFFEVSRADSLTPGQVQEIKNHLDLTLNKPKNRVIFSSDILFTGNLPSCGTGPYGSLGTIDKVDLSKIDSFKPNPYYYNSENGLTGINYNIPGSC